MDDDVVDELLSAHRPWTSGSPGCKDCGTNEPCAAQRAAAELVRMRNALGVYGLDWKFWQHEVPKEDDE